MKGINAGLVLGTYTYAGFGHMYHGLLGGEIGLGQRTGSRSLSRSIAKVLTGVLHYYQPPISSIETF
jgi:hypothetical protein